MNYVLHVTGTYLSKSYSYERSGPQVLSGIQIWTDSWKRTYWLVSSPTYRSPVLKWLTTGRHWLRADDHGSVLPLEKNFSPTLSSVDFCWGVLCGLRQLLKLYHFMRLISGVATFFVFGVLIFSGVWGKAPAAMILVHFEDLDTLLMTSKCAFFYAYDLSFHAHPCLNRAHGIFLYFVSQKITAPNFGVPSAGAAPVAIDLYPLQLVVVCLLICIWL